MRNYVVFAFILSLAIQSAFAAEPDSSQQQLKRQVSLELEEVEGATSYEVELSSKATGKTSSFKMKQPLWKAAIKPGDFSLRLRSYDSRGVPGAWSEAQPFTVKLPGPALEAPVAGEIIKTGEATTHETEFKWTSISGTKNYRLEVTPEGSTTPVTELFTNNFGKITLSVAIRYTWKVIPIANSGDEGESQETPGDFTLVGKPIDTPNIEKPEDIWVLSLKWERPEFTDSFTYVMQRKDEKGQWQRIEMKENYSATETPLDVKYPGGAYRVAIKAVGNLREPSKVARADFKVYTGDRTPAAVEEAKLRYSLEKPTSWYFVASYLLTQVTYTGQNPQAGAGRSVTYNALGGTGRLGLGYINPTNNRGYLGIVDMSGFTIAGQNVTYKAAELHHVWRYTWGRNMVRPSAGLFYKELVEAQDQLLNPGVFKMLEMSYAGPHAGFDFWRPFTNKLGMQLNARMYYGLLGMRAPNGQDQQPELSYQLGIMGSYKLKPNITGFMGWAYRTDRGSYKSTAADNSTSFAPAGGVQTIQIEGNFFNLLLEWGF